MRGKDKVVDATADPTDSMQSQTFTQGKFIHVPTPRGRWQVLTGLELGALEEAEQAILKRQRVSMRAVQEIVLGWVWKQLRLRMYDWIDIVALRQIIVCHGGGRN